MLSKNRLLLTVSVLAVSTILMQASALSQSLEETLAMAYENNPSIQAQRATLRSIDETVPQARGGWRPTVDLNGSAGFIKPNFNGNNTSRDFYSTGVGITQNVYAGGGTEAAIQQAESDVLASRARLHSVEQSVLLQAVTAYMNVLRDESVLELNIQNEIRLQRQLEATSDRFEVGEVTRTDVAQAESRVSGAQADRIASEGILNVSKAFFKQVVGTEPVNLTSPNINPVLPKSLAESISLAQNKNPDIQALVNDRDSAQAEITIQQADLLPSINLTGDADYRRDVSANDLRGNDLTVAAAISIPLYQAGIATSQVRQAKQLVGVSNRQIEDTTRKTIELATSAWETLQTQQARIVSFKDQVRATSIALDGVEQEAAVGSRTVLDVLDAEQELLDARVNLVRTRRDEIVARFELLNAVGGLSAREIGLVVEAYDEAAHYNKVKDEIWGISDALDDETPKN